MDLDIEMDVDDVVDTPQVPAVYTEDIITGEEQVRSTFQCFVNVPTYYLSR